METNQPTTVDQFLALRADWKAKGEPADHEYLTDVVDAMVERTLPVEPLVAGITAEMVKASASLSGPSYVVGVGDDGRTRWEVAQ